MRIAKRAGASLAAFTVALAGLTLVAPTSAQAGVARCKANQLCLFEGENFTGGVFAVAGTCDLDLGDNHFDDGTPVVDRASSLVNNTKKAAFVSEFPYPYRRSGYELAVWAGGVYSGLHDVQVYNYRVGKYQRADLDNNASAFCV
ncbi:peptidase inhibitor family I36 protein [Paractinoplanes atraurantiacus]|uniref:Peptidase inhibitor family I36 n=1 Tax=Paractinoplanes atraurantiacus TaxID=1036182 RepID=A0A285GL57_9ACTN|nr:peptidase inhibitor family I36 protein [Actinoplanes atraurantiacus]SNY24185.1 Peptidase inhibitor family I36 [Actinoplanes atraurantiacus]